MLFLLRNIRRKLLSSKNKAASYLLYAVGEVFLVVIGILIAVQINNWQEHKRSRLTEITVLQNIQNDLESDTSDLIFNLRMHHVFLESEKKLLNYMQGNTQVDIAEISIENALGSPLFSALHDASFTNLQNNDLGIITNNNLKQKISRHYDFFVRSIRGLENEKADYETYPIKFSYFLRHFILANEYNVLSTEDLQTKNFYNPQLERPVLKANNTANLMKDEAFKIVLAESILIRQVKIGFYEDFLNRTRELNKLIDQELKLLSAK
jgi:hypothetical protein